MQIRINTSKGLSVVQVVGDLLAEPDQVKLRDKVREVIGQGGRQIIVDLSRMKYTNSCGLGALVCLLTTARRNGGDVKLSGMNAEVGKLFMMTRLNEVFHTYPNVTSAIDDCLPLPTTPA